MNNRIFATRHFLACLAAILLIGWTVAACPAQDSEKSATSDQKGGEKTIKLVVDYGDGVQKQFAAIPWKEKQTVFDVLQTAAKHPRGIKFKHRGSGAATLVVEIDELANEAGGKNWLYEVNGKLADRSSAIYEVEPGDTLLWKFAKYR